VGEQLSLGYLSTIPVAARTFSPGFRFSTSDAIALFVGLIVAGDTAAVMPWPGVVIGFVFLHFFLFCNVVRMDRFAELVWAAVFVLLAASTITMGLPLWPATLAISFATAVTLVVLELRKPSYHGIFWRQINPGLPQWWEASA
jgi:hypothetical protein